MTYQHHKNLKEFLDILGLMEEPIGIFHTDIKPAEGFSPKCGLHQLAMFVTNDPEVVTSPWGAACTNLITWPFRYLAKGENRAVLGGWDPSARKFFKTDELSFTVPYEMFGQMVKRFGESFLTTKTWTTVQKKIARSNQAWARKTER